MSAAVNLLISKFFAGSERARYSPAISPVHRPVAPSVEAASAQMWSPAVPPVSFYLLNHPPARKLCGHVSHRARRLYSALISSEAQLPQCPCRGAKIRLQSPQPNYFLSVVHV